MNIVGILNRIQLTILFLVMGMTFQAQAAPVVFVGKSKDIELFLLKSEGWTSKDLKRNEIHLADDPNKTAISISSKLECGTRTCTTYLFEPSDKEKFHLIGKIDGMMELLPDSHNRHFDIQATSSIGGGADEKSQVIYQFNGKAYQPAPRGTK